ncbi:MAG: RNA 3'-terminal phosphate cyclase [Candidatus Nitrosotenuis sp.]
MDILKIDGSFGEGGGQILRSALALSCITKKPIQIENIRHNRKTLGLKPSHLTAIKILAKICNAQVDGLQIGSTSIKFFPNEIQDTNLKENVGTAGSISLILQAIIPAVSLARKKLNLSITGGTDVPWSPTTNYTKYVMAEAYSRIGINFSLDVKKCGYYPKGGGIVDISVLPCQKINPVSLTQRTQRDAKILCSYSDLPENKIASSIEHMRNELEKNSFTVQTQINYEKALDSGASALIFSHDSGSVVGIDELQDRKTEFGAKSPSKFIGSLGVDANLSDMLVAPLSLTREVSVFTVNEISKHLETNLYITSKITGCKYGVGKIDGGYEVRIQGSSETSIE